MAPRGTGTLPSAGGLLLIEDLPRPHNPGDVAFREELIGCFRYLLDHAPCPVVLVVSEGEECVFAVWLGD